jgi:hypothetical protein
MLSRKGGCGAAFILLKYAKYGIIAEDFFSLFTAYDLETFSASVSGSLKFLAAALVMAMRQWGLGLISYC